MAQSSWPFENIDTNETQFSQWARNIGEGVKTGALNELEVFADSTGMQVKIRSGQALVRGHYYQNTAEVTLTLAAADATNPRIDTVVLELDPSANTITLETITGVAESSPSAEPLVQTDAGIYQIKLANIAVGSGVTTISAGNVTDTRFYIEDFSGTVPGSAITGEITTATMDGDRLFGNIDSATISQANVTGTIVTDATAARTITSSDAGKTIRFTSGSATVVTVNASTDFAVGERVDILADGAGELTVLADGATVAAAETSTTTGSFTVGAQYSAATLLCVATDEYRLIGNIGVV
jgi:hypothetical protein